MRKFFCAIIVSLVLLATLTSIPSLRATTADAVLFDDFSYTNKDQMKKNGWIIRTEPGWPGVPGAKWLEAGVSILKDPDQP